MAVHSSAVPLGDVGLDLVAAGFGVGAGLTLDEYALDGRRRCAPDRGGGSSTRER